MKQPTNRLLFLFSIAAWLSLSHQIIAQDTQIRGFANVDFYLQDDKLNFGIGEWDLFITSDLGEKFSFLGETVFKYAPSSSTNFSVGVERLVINFNYKGNHSILVGKHHTPILYWNDNYHHGRVFFPTIGRPLLFAAGIIPIHTTGIAFQGLNLGKLKWGYNLMVGNGIGSSDVADNNTQKSLTAAINARPVNNLQVGVSFYSDFITTAPENTSQQLYTASVAYFSSKFEVLAEGTLINNNIESTGNQSSSATYIYGGYRIKEKWVPYIRVDFLNYESGETYFGNENTNSFVGGVRYEVSYLIVVKMEYQYTDQEIAGSSNRLSAQLAIGF